MPIYQKCCRCKGTGKVAMNGAHADTLEVLKKQKQEISGVALSRIVGCKPTAMNNRLTYLQKLGLAKGRAYGRMVLWRAV